jgi:hypothetical protein
MDSQVGSASQEIEAAVHTDTKYRGNGTLLLLGRTRE